LSTLPGRWIKAYSVARQRDATQDCSAAWQDDGDLPLPLFFFQTEKITFTHIGITQRLMGLVAFFLPVFLPFFVAGVVDGVDVAVDILLDAAAGAARAAAFFLVFFILAAAEGTGGWGHDDNFDLNAGRLCNVRCW
jgi:hypothetical protein